MSQMLCSIVTNKIALICFRRILHSADGSAHPEAHRQRRERPARVQVRFGPGVTLLGQVVQGRQRVLQIRPPGQTVGADFHPTRRLCRRK